MRRALAGFMSVAVVLTMCGRLPADVPPAKVSLAECRAVRIVGTWETLDGDHTMTLNADGTGKWQTKQPAREADFEWECSESALVLAKLSGGMRSILEVERRGVFAVTVSYLSLSVPDALVVGPSGPLQFRRRAK